MQPSNESVTELKAALKHLREQLAHKEREIYSIQRIGKALSSTLRLEELLHLIMQEVTELMEADRSTLYLVDRERQEIWSLIAQKAEVREIRQKLGKGISGYVAASGETVNIPDAYQDSRFDPSTDKRTGYRTRSILCMPIWEPLSPENQREVLGVIQVLNKKSGPFTPEDEHLLEAIAAQVAVSIANSRLFHQIEKKYREMDLLYEFEQLLSEEFNLDQIIEKLLQKTTQHLQAGHVVALFKRGEGWVAGLADDGGQTKFQAFAGLPEQLEKWVHQPEGERVLPHWPLLNTVFPGLQPPENPGSILIASIRPAGLLLAIDVPSSGGRGLQDERRLLELVAQKFTRALELARLRETLLQQERLSAIGKMMSTIVHDLRSPVGVIYGFVDLLRQPNLSEEERNEFLEIIRRETQSIMSMVTEILDFAKGKTTILPRKIGVRNLIKRFEPQLRQMCEKSNVQLHLSVNSNKLLYADEDKLLRVFFNITKNALEAMGEGGEFTFTVEDRPGEVVFVFKDTGPGIPPEIQHRLFDSFVTSGKESGTGLGLAIVKKIVDEHKGRIELESQPGQGTTFRVVLPEFKK
ncbi:MAG: GAF domain-containing protein [Calditrichaeota bacterium]|nr:MAG: GAF domain-containing protein [Calditrichota bacterium]